MNLKDALLNLRDRDDWKTVLAFLLSERESAIVDFQSPDYLDNPIKLARLSGEISAIDRIFQNLNETRRSSD